MPIRPGTTAEANPASGDWVFVDVGFANATKSCGILVGNAKPINCTFSDLRLMLSEICGRNQGPLNLLFEAPLSVAFGLNGNPTGRSVEKRNGQTRYWYVGLGCSVLVATTYLLRSIHDQRPNREIRLFEGLVSFKAKGTTSSHTNDVKTLRDIVWQKDPRVGEIVDPNKLAAKAGDKVESAFAVSGMDFGVPAIIIAAG